MYIDFSTVESVPTLRKPCLKSGYYQRKEYAPYRDGEHIISFKSSSNGNRKINLKGNKVSSHQY